MPWLKRAPGVNYAPPGRVPAVIYERYRSFDDPASSYRVSDVDQGGALHSRVGLRPGDKIISVNGQPIGSTAAAGRELFERLKGEEQFVLVVERDGQRRTVTFSVGD